MTSVENNDICEKYLIASFFKKKKKKSFTSKEQ